MNFTIARKNKGGAIAWADEQVRYIHDSYVFEDKTLKELGAEFGVQPQSIRNLLRKCDVEITSKKTRGYPRISDYFHIINTHEKAYWLGILLSDGSINRNAVVLNLKDREHIEKFKNAIGAINHAITEVKDNRWAKECKTYQFSIRDTTMINDLAQYGMVANKTYIGFDFPDLPKEFIWDFVRGYFDGDGSLYYTDNKYVISIVGQKNFLNKVKEIFEKPQISLCQNSVSKITYDLKISGKKDVKRILTQMYENSTETTRLERKYNIALNIIDNQLLEAPRP